MQSSAQLSIEHIAAVIARARAERRCLDAPLEGVGIAEAQAYAVQALMTSARLDRGERVVGWKLGYTSAVMREQMGIASANFGPLTDAMILTDGSVLPETVIHPRVEPEVAVVLAGELAGDVDIGDVAAAIGSARAALEVVDSVWCNYRFTWADNTADGSSAAYIVLGPALDVSRIDQLRVTLLHNDEVAGSGSSSAAMGNPLAAVQWLCRQLHAVGRRLNTGDVVMTGGITPAVTFEPGDQIAGDFDGVRVSVRRRGRLAP